MKLWTVTLDYYATGEGRTFFGRVGYADAEKDGDVSLQPAMSDYRTGPKLPRTKVLLRLSAPEAVHKIFGCFSAPAQRRSRHHRKPDGP
jgi:hypothetical protein